MPWLLAVAMMRPGDKLASFRMLGAALAAVGDLPWRLLVVGDGPARPEVTAALAADIGESRVVYAGRQDAEELGDFHDAADLFVWPAVNEAYGMALLEAQAAGLPAIAGASGGVADIMRHGETGLLVAPDDPDGFAAAVRVLLEDPARRGAMGVAAARRCAAEHSFEDAVRLFGDTLARVLETYR